MNKKLWIAGAVTLLLGIAIGCAPNQNGDPVAGAVVFPGEAYLGGTVAMVISTNYAPGSDLEVYGLHKENTEVRVFYGTGDNDYMTAEINTVFDANLSPASRAAVNAPGGFSTLVFFDLPPELDPELAPYPHAHVKIEVYKTGGSDLASFGFVEVLGKQDGAFGTATSLGVGFDSDPAVPGNDGRREMEEGLQPQTMIRLRAVHNDGIPPEKQPGFGAVPGQQIGAIEFYVMYSNTCMDNLRAYTSSEASGATVMLGPVGGYGSASWRKVVLIDPNGFTLDKPATSYLNGEPAGEGPFLDLAFDWLGTPDCSTFPWTLEAVTDGVDYVNLVVTDLDGQVLIREPSMANDFFTEHLVDLLPET